MLEKEMLEPPCPSPGSGQAAFSGSDTRSQQQWDALPCTPTTAGTGHPAASTDKVTFQEGTARRRSNVSVDSLAFAISGHLISAALFFRHGGLLWSHHSLKSPSSK